MKHFKSLSAVASAGLLALSMVAMPVCAAEYPYPTDVAITENDPNDESFNVELPDRVVFKYKTLFGDDMVKDFLDKASDYTVTDTDREDIRKLVDDQVNPGTNRPKKEGETEAPTDSLENHSFDIIPVNDELDVTITNSPQKDATGNLIAKSYKNIMKIDLRKNDDGTIKATKPGIYYFELKEDGHYYTDNKSDDITVDDNTKSTLTTPTAPKVDGIDADDDQKVLVAVVVSYGGDGNLQVGQLVWYEKHQESSTTTLNKVTDTDNKEWWDKGGDAQQTDWSYFKAEYNTCPLTITKTVTGNMGDKTKPFDINYSISSNTAYQKTLPLTYSDGVTGQPDSVTNKGAYPEDHKASLKHEQSVTIHGLAANDLVKVWESFTKKGENNQNVDDPNADGYAVSYTKKAGKEGAATEAINTGMPNNGSGTYANITQIGGATDADNLKNNYTVEVTNEKKGGPITGIVHNYGPFALMAAVGAAMIGFFFRRRREE